MKIPVGKIAGWVLRALVSAAVSEAADRLARPRSEKHGDGAADVEPALADRDQRQAADQDHLQHL